MRREPKYIFALLVLIACILAGFALLGIVPRHHKVFDIAQPAAALQIVTTTDDSPAKMYKQSEVIQQLNSLVGNKMATRVFNVFGKGRDYQPVMTSNFDKSTGYTVDEKGRVMVLVDKGDIRNKSALHWLWWKLNGLYDPATSLVYRSDPDTQIADQVRLILEKAGQQR